MENNLDIKIIKEHLSDRWWRLNNLYYVKDEDGNKVLFKPNPTQKILYDGLWFFTIVPKARQLGITTFFTILYLDQILFSENKTAGIIAHRQEDMKKIFRNKIRFAWENLHPWLKESIGEPNTDSAQELVFPNGSTIFVSMTTRSGTVQFLHISEFGYVCQKFPEKAEEIVTGAINSVHTGNMVSIESTAAGRDGYFYDFCEDAEKLRKSGRTLTELDFKIFFFPWFIDDRYVLEGDIVITTEMKEYFSKLEKKHDIILSQEQKNWYVKKEKLQKSKMWQEYPSTLEEAFSQAVEGSYYANEMNKVYKENRIMPLPHDTNLDVHTAWDLGRNDFNVIIFFQTKGSQIRIIDLYYNSGFSLKHYYDELARRKQEFGYNYGRHGLPHDAAVTDLSAEYSREQTLNNYGLYNTIVVPKVPSVNDDIDLVRRHFSKFFFDEVKCKKLTDALHNYHKEFNKKLGQFVDKPKHDGSSHFADAMRTLVHIWHEEMPLSEEEKDQSDNQSFFG